LSHVAVVLDRASDFPSPPKGLEREVSLSPLLEEWGRRGDEQHLKDGDNKMGKCIKSKYLMSCAIFRNLWNNKASLNS
jgi:hypothetical protein